MALKETTNNVNITGVLVKKEFEYLKLDKKDQNGNILGKEDAISGTLVLRTVDGSEHEVKYFSRKLKRDGSENGIYKGLETVSKDYKSLEYYPDNADVIRIGGSKFTPNDYKGNDGEVKSYTQISSNFANRLDQKEIEITPLEANFEIEGVVESISDETYKNEPTGNLRVTVNVIGYDNTIVPVVVVVTEDMVQAFREIGFYEGGFAKFTGRLINTKEVREIVEQMAFGKDNVKTVTTTVSRKEVTGGNPMGTLYENEIDEAEYQQAKSKRKLKLEEIKKSERNNSQTNNVNAPKTNTTTNPFNPFAK